MAVVALHTPTFGMLMATSPTIRTLSIPPRYRYHGTEIQLYFKRGARHASTAIKATSVPMTWTIRVADSNDVFRLNDEFIVPWIAIAIPDIAAVKNGNENNFDIDKPPCLNLQQWKI